VFKKANRLLSSRKSEHGSAQGDSGRATFLTPKDYLDALAPSAESFIEACRAYASIYMVELLEAFVRLHSTVPAGLRQPSAGLMIVVASVLYSGLVDLISLSERDQHTEAQKFLGEYLLHSLKIFCNYAFPSVEGLIQDLTSVRPGKSLPKSFTDRLAAQLDRPAPKTRQRRMTAKAIEIQAVDRPRAQKIRTLKCAIGRIQRVPGRIAWGPWTGFFQQFRPCTPRCLTIRSRSSPA